MPSAYLQWWFHSGERVVARGPLFSFFISNGWRFKQVTHPILGILVELFPFNKITLKSHIFVLLLPSWASNVGVKLC